MKMYLATDHNGIQLKKELEDYLNSNGVEVFNVDIQNNDTDDYPDFAFSLCKNVVANNALGILICGNGIGMSIAANKVKGIRAARVCTIDDAFKAKNHNGANVITFGANLDLELVKEIVNTFIATKGPTEERHIRREQKIIDYENGAYNEL